MLSYRAALMANVLALLAISLVLAAAFFVQFTTGELPCPLCNMQRAALLGLAAGPALNIAFGIRSRHYGFTILAAVLGAIVAGRQILLHIAPGDPGYGAPLFGLHLYTWAFLAFAAAIVLSATMLIIGVKALQGEASAGWARLAILPIVVLGALNLGSTVMQCGGGLCPDNPTSYLLLQGASPAGGPG